MDENNTPDIDNSNVPSQKKKIPRQRKYRQGTHLNALCKKIRIQRKWKNTHKLKQECGFLHYLAHSKYIPQSKTFLHQLLSEHQYTILRELVVNDLAVNLPTYSSTMKKAKLRKSLKRRLEHLAKGQYHKEYLPILFPYLQLLAIHTGLTIPWHL